VSQRQSQNVLKHRIAITAAIVITIIITTIMIVDGVCQSAGAAEALINGHTMEIAHFLSFGCTCSSSSSSSSVITGRRRILLSPRIMQRAHDNSRLDVFPFTNAALQMMQQS
jgi:hypothetical protein